MQSFAKEHEREDSTFQYLEERSRVAYFPSSFRQSREGRNEKGLELDKILAGASSLSLTKAQRRRSLALALGQDADELYSSPDAGHHTTATTANTDSSNAAAAPIHGVVLSKNGIVMDDSFIDASGEMLRAILQAVKDPEGEGEARAKRRLEAEAVGPTQRAGNANFQRYPQVVSRSSFNPSLVKFDLLDHLDSEQVPQHLLLCILYADCLNRVFY